MAAGQADLLLDARLDGPLLGDEPTESVQRDERCHVGFPFGKEAIFHVLRAVLVPMRADDSWPGAPTAGAAGGEL